MTAIIIGEGESFYRKGTVMKKTQFEKKKKFRRLAAVSLALCMAAVGMACGNGEAVSSSTEDLTSKYRSEAASQEDVPIEEAFAISYLDFSLQLLRDSRTSGEQKKTEGGEEDKASRGSNTMVSSFRADSAGNDPGRSRKGYAPADGGNHVSRNRSGRGEKRIIILVQTAAGRKGRSNEHGQFHLV